MARSIFGHITGFIWAILHNLWVNKRNPKYYGPVFTVFLAVSYTSGLLQLLLSWILFILIILFSIVSGLAVVLCRGDHRKPPPPRPTPQQQNLSNFMAKMTRSLNKHYYTPRLVISKDLDKALQEVIDLIVRDFCLSWFRNVGEDETAFVEILNKEFWTIIENLRERLRRVDNLKFLCDDLIQILYEHCHNLKLSDAGKYPGQTTPFLLHPCLKEKNSEMKYVRTIAEALIYCLLPDSDSGCASMRYLLREVIAGSIILPTAESICDPDYVNQTIVYYMEDKVKITGGEKKQQKYAYAETYEDFIKMINTATDVETLKQLRYHTIAEIMQATVIHNTKDHLTEHDGDGSKDGSNKKQSKKDALRDRNLKKYINQCRVSKQQCEKRIRRLGGPDYRYYGLGHGQPMRGAEKQKAAKKSKSVSILAFNDILDNGLARSFFYEYLKKQSMGNLLYFWIAIEKLRLLKQIDLQPAAAEIFQEYVTPSAPTVIKLESRLVRGMEDFVNGIGERDSFYEAQQIVHDIMETRYYPEFVISPDYTKYVCQAESVLDNIRAHVTDDQYLDITTIPGGEGFGFKERRKAEELKEAMPSNIEERNDYAVRTLQGLDHNINATTQAIDLISRSHPVNVTEKERMETRLEQLNTERRHLEFHIERTDLWCEKLGYWKANISSGQYLDDKEPVFVICVSCDDENMDVKQDEQTTATTGWVVCRQLKDFTALHEKLKECCSWMSKELPVSSQKWLNDLENLESMKKSLQEYLTIILSDERLSKSDHIYTFLIPSPEHLRIETASSTQGTSKESSPRPEKKKAISFITNIKDSLNNLASEYLSDIGDADVDEVEEVGMEEETVNYKKDSIAQPMYTLIGEVFELKGVFKVLRKTLITFVQVTFGGTINRHLREFVAWLVSEPMLLYYIDNFKLSWWPKGKLAAMPRERTDLEKLRTREQAKERMMKNIPDVLVNLVGRRNSNVGFLKLFEAAQDIRTNKHFFYVFLELVVTTVCPEIKSPEVFVKADKLYQSKKRTRTRRGNQHPMSSNSA